MSKTPTTSTAADDPRMIAMVKNFQAARVAADKLRDLPSANDADTQKAIAVIYDAYNRSVANNTATQWTGEAFIRLFGEALRDLRALHTSLVIKHCMPPAVELRVLAGIPDRLMTAHAHLMADAYPAMLKTPDDLDRRLVPFFIHMFHDTMGLMFKEGVSDARPALQHQVGQMIAMGELADPQSPLMQAVEHLCMFAVAIAHISFRYAPASNPRALLFAREIDMQLRHFKTAVGMSVAATCGRLVN